MYIKKYNTLQPMKENSRSIGPNEPKYGQMIYIDKINQMMHLLASIKLKIVVQKYTTR